MHVTKTIAEELGVNESQVDATIKLLDEGASVPFIARYRKEITGALDDVQLRQLSERLTYLRELEERRAAVIASVEEQGKMTDELRKAMLGATTKTRLEDLYLPYKQKRRTRGQIAIEAGIEPLADMLLSDPMRVPEQEAEAFINTADEFKDAFKDAKGVLDGARFILMERFAEHADLIEKLRNLLTEQAYLSAEVIPGKETEGKKFSDYFAHEEPIGRVPSHRAMAMLRGRREGILNLKIDVPLAEDASKDSHPALGIIANTLGIKHEGRPADDWLTDVVRWTWRVKLHLHLETEFVNNLREQAEEGAIEVFAANLKDLLLAAPAGQATTIGLDPGLRTGVKVAVIDGTGKFLEHTNIFPHAPQNQWDQAMATLADLAKRHDAKLIAIGNGTASRETDKLVVELIKRHPELGIQGVIVNEAGASVYSASELATQEFPDLDVTVRGAISIGRRLQDPLAELVKIEPKSIGVGQYQHDVNQFKLGKNLDAVIEDCVNAVGVEVNTASAALLKRVAGVNQTIAENIVNFRNENGAFASRKQLMQVPRLGEKAFEQCAGFLRIQNGNNALDASAVHPEAYTVVDAMAAAANCQPAELIGNSSALKALKPEAFVSEEFGLPTITDILTELDKPGRDPRPEFKTAKLTDGVEEIKDVTPGMILEGTVTNVTHFGAFVDIGVHQDGLVHISALSNKFVKDPREVVKAGDVVKVKALEIDLERKRISLTMRLDDPLPSEDQPKSKPRRDQRSDSNRGNNRNNQQRGRGRQNEPKPQGALAAAFEKARNKKR
ncbi:MAG: Tex family protein [Pseudomonadales bacterium]